ncbi:hypothetical protein M422DRAFT_163059 [Sphaerobolus stellatus SS14]|uniref:Uncharacterized protein n=1 Tax=Sphaerobolus stellatus (strain SS14) TaxID=990650 RepID=A0A0C9UWA7_SPHS4|nr:hypothetical protein M422DRAFT_163059 [Sphaerobolus stellatus SS14]
MIHNPTGARQPRTAWSPDHLKHERAVALSHVLEASTSVTYTSQLQSYLSFCKMHSFSAKPTSDTLSFFVVYIVHHIKPSSVGCYLSGICNLLEPYYPDVRIAHSAPIVHHTLAGMEKLWGALPMHRKRAQEHDDLMMIISHLPPCPSHDELLFVTMLFTGFHGLLRLGELTIPDAIAKCTRRKLTLRHTLSFEGDTRFSFTLPFHKADLAGHSLRSGGATALALASVPENVIQGLGRWSSDTWRIYIQKHPVLLQALLHGNSAFQTLPSSSTALSSLPISNRE